MDFVDLTDGDAVAKSIEVAAVPTRSSYRLKKGVVNIVGSNPSFPIHDYLAHLASLAAKLRIGTGCLRLLRLRVVH